MASQKMALLVVAAGLLCMSALLNGAEASCGGFTYTCQVFSVTGSVVSANCAKVDGVYAESSLDLNPFLGNDNGNLVQRSDYIATCTPEGFGLVGDSSFFIFANCAQEDGKFVSTFLDINNNVSNDNGVLTWNSC
ncbi:hypothetical protein CY35_12G008900 [Sphagnum magellanicum]|nr:hypothetical protein CY35_12G008900 [Sphagnum magellanicum]